MKYNLIAVEGEYHSGAVEVGNTLAKKLDISCYASDVIQTAAARGHTSTDDIKRLKETTNSKLLREVYTLPFFERIPINKRHVIDTEKEILRCLAESGSFIIVESGLAKNALPELQVFSVFIYKSFHARIQYAAQLQVESSLQHTARIAKKHDRFMATRYEMYSNCKWSDRIGYDMVLDSEELGFDGCADAIVAIVKEKNN
jgi:cytidylate kinase